MVNSDFRPHFYDESSGSGLAVPKNSQVRVVRVLESPSHICTFTNGASGDTVLVIPANAGVGSWFEMSDDFLDGGLYFNHTSHTAGQFSASAYVSGA